MKALVTGASGFVGKALCARLAASGAQVVPAVRSKYGLQHEVVIGNLNASTNWRPGLTGCDAVIHLAARVHVMEDVAQGSLALYRDTNTEATFNLARQAADAGVKRFVFISSIKVNGEFTEVDRPFTSEDVPAPDDPYGVSKREAEQLLRQIAAKTGMEVVIIRPPLVYGLGVKANFAAMMRWLARGVPLPLAAVTENRRSLVALDNLVDLIMTCLNHPAAANQTFLVSDGEDLSTAELLKRMSVAMGKPARLFYVPPALLKLGAHLLNRPGIYQRLCGSLQLDIAKTRQLLGWTPPVSVDEGLRRATEGYRS
ncbi:SDR family oxidoreductase [Laribacter hongkongensis]|uniref:UDP-glucose 4-epimerase family protein n=1 Tax=Laribacter hongkongensis TaxID=168471 RepID=UPI001EFECFA4|nr:SDR family oxidoreductase [Laribacter hongkongensis]MCG9029702.1 SDR family oxidoreductase [Laribacter hongkongensis]MCG9035833.1 SDR family oxidoreductase [Laribacter hongkongensis]MCG9038551.1 SDR family oxidoreductase [Laribacter hongkongensis]MCG9071510.1 SDR family oxidoreductase [Laribacter hongkongensis]MCG9107133.1 SDR family oxidoreductase [Laribacter hongkongensis]